MLACAARALTRRSVPRRPVLPAGTRSVAGSAVCCAPPIAHRSLVPQGHTGCPLVSPALPTLLQCRSKSKKAKGKAAAAKEEEDEEEEDEEEDEQSAAEPGDNERTAFVSSLRIDSIMKAGINMPKMKVLECFYNGSIRLNGQKVLKKGAQVSVGDEVDHVLGFTAQNPNLMEVNRVTLLASNHDRMTEKGRFQVRLRCQRRLVIEKYPDADREDEE